MPQGTGTSGHTQYQQQMLEYLQGSTRQVRGMVIQWCMLGLDAKEEARR